MRSAATPFPCRSRVQAAFTSRARSRSLTTPRAHRSSNQHPGDRDALLCRKPSFPVVLLAAFVSAALQAVTGRGASTRPVARNSDSSGTAQPSTAAPGDQRTADIAAGAAAAMGTAVALVGSAGPGALPVQQQDSAWGRSGSASDSDEEAAAKAMVIQLLTHPEDTDDASLNTSSSNSTTSSTTSSSQPAEPVWPEPAESAPAATGAVVPAAQPLPQPQRASWWSWWDAEEAPHASGLQAASDNDEQEF